MLVTLPNPHPKAPAHPSTLKVLQAMERALTLYSSVVSTLDSHLIYKGGWERVNMVVLVWFT
jgi:hypothetical protein